MTSSTRVRGTPASAGADAGDDLEPEVDLSEGPDGALDPDDWLMLNGARWRQRAGRITVDGVDLVHFPAEEWRDRLSGAFQDFFFREGVVMTRFFSEVCLEPDGDGTLLRVVESGFAQLPVDTRTETYDSHSEGWSRELSEQARAHVEAARGVPRGA